METEINSNQNLETPKSRLPKLGTGLIFSIVLISLLAGASAGAFGALLIYKTLPSVSKQLEVTEDSAVIDVVKEQGPAVVSIIVSKNLSLFQNQQSFNSPFFFDPFYQFRNQPQNSAPQFQQTGAGSGFFVSADGLILTNKHVVSDTDAKYTVITQDGKKYDAKVLSTDPVNDLAIVKIDIKDAPTINLADSSKIEIGQRVIAIGNSLGQYSNTVTTGIVSGIGRNITAGDGSVSEQLEGVIQTDAAINPGNSGGPLLNVFGEVIGVNTAIDQQGQLVGFAIPSNDAQRAVKSFETMGKIVRPFIGIRYQLINPALKAEKNLPVDNGALVASGTESDGSFSPAVLSGGAADKAGIKDGDILLSVNDEKIDADHSLASLIKKYSPGDKLVLDILRDNKNLEISLIVGSK